RSERTPFEKVEVEAADSDPPAPRGLARERAAHGDPCYTAGVAPERGVVGRATICAAVRGVALTTRSSGCLRWSHYHAVARRAIGMAKRRAVVTVGALGLERASSVPLYRQLYDGLREAILSGRLRPGARLPSTRVLAGDLETSRNT